ncbi:MAG: STAS domain-containing protein, partial [Ignavibacteriaceae bacterium]|nr:STAS domain-containing protein [Ignavibacteriaceae bacterium]
MHSIEKKIDNYAVVFNINLLRATLNEAAEFKDYLAQAILETDKDIIVNLSNCEHLDSTFLGVLVSSFKKLKTQNRNLLI